MRGVYNENYKQPVKYFFKNKCYKNYLCNTFLCLVPPLTYTKMHIPA